MQQLKRGGGGGGLPLDFESDAVLGHQLETMGLSVRDFYLKRGSISGKTKKMEGSMVRIRQILANFPGNYTNLDTFLTKNY